MRSRPGRQGLGLAALGDPSTCLLWWVFSLCPPRPALCLLCPVLPHSPSGGSTSIDHVRAALPSGCQLGSATGKSQPEIGGRLGRKVHVGRWGPSATGPFKVLCFLWFPYVPPTPGLGVVTTPLLLAPVPIPSLVLPP